MKTLYFEGAGWSNAEISKATIGNCRIRTAFHLNDGRAVYLEIIAGTRTSIRSPKNKKNRPQYIGFIDCCYYITDDKPNNDCNKHRLPDDKYTKIDYTRKDILNFVNSLGASFDKIEVAPDLGGYRVFPEKNCCLGTKGYNYGDEFQLNPILVSRREAIYNWAYQLEKKELEADKLSRAGKFIHSPSCATYPTFSLWVDEKDPGLLHLLRHFNGKNKHWLIRIDSGNTLEDWINSMTEVYLGKYGC